MAKSVPRKAKINPESRLTADLWAGAAHALTQPVQAAGLLSRALAARPGAARCREIEHKIALSLSGLQGMHDLLSSVAKIESRAAAGAAPPQPLGQVIAAGLQRISTLERSRHVAIDSGSVPVARIDAPDLVRLAIEGMLFHALATAAAARIAVRAGSRGSQLVVEVELAGQSPEVEIERSVFVELTRSDQPRQMAVGFGLASVARIASGLGGGLSCRARGNLQVLELGLPPAADGR